MNEKRKRYEISVNLNDPGSVSVITRSTFSSLSLTFQKIDDAAAK